MRLKIYGYYDRMGAIRKMPRKRIRIARNAGNIAGMTEYSFLTDKRLQGILQAFADYAKSSGLISSSSTSEAVNGERSLTGVSGGSWESFGACMACRCLRMGCSRKLMRFARKEGKL